MACGWKKAAAREPNGWRALIESEESHWAQGSCVPGPGFTESVTDSGKDEASTSYRNVLADAVVSDGANGSGTLSNNKE